MRVLSHPNVVDLRAFFYTSGEKVCDYLLTFRKMKCILTWYWNMFQRLYIALRVIIPR